MREYCANVYQDEIPVLMARNELCALAIGKVASAKAYQIALLRSIRTNVTFILGRLALSRHFLASAGTGNPSL